MNNYKKLINLIKPEFQSLYTITKNVGEENTFQLSLVKMDKGSRTLTSLMTFRNVQNPMKVMKDGKHPYISEVSGMYAAPDIINHMDIPSEVAELVYSTINLNNKKNEMHLFFDNIFSGGGVFKNYKCSTTIKVKISKDYSTVDYLMVEQVADVSFRKEEVTLKDTTFIDNIHLFGRVKTYLKKKQIIIDIHNKQIIIENLDERKPVVQTMTYEEFKQHDNFMVEDIKQRGKDYLQMKINDIDAFKWSATDD